MECSTPMRWVLLVATLTLACAPLSREVLARRQRAALEREDWLEAVRLGRARVAAGPLDIAARYDLACALTRLGDEDDALRTLSEAIALGYDDASWLDQDADLSVLRRRPEFPLLREDAQRVARDGIVVLNTRVVVRAEVPMPVRLRLPMGAQRLRLAVWLHPTGSRLNPDIERLAPVLLRHGYALAVPTSPRLDGWDDLDLTALLEGTVPALADLVDVEHPLLIGLSGGAEAALVAWATTPERFAAVLAAAPPADQFGGMAHPERAAHQHLEPPTSPRASPVAFFFGDSDPLRLDWEVLLPEWRAHGVSFTTTVIPGRGHEMLFDEALLERELSALHLNAT